MILFAVYVRIFAKFTEKPAIMLKKIPKQPQIEMFQPLLISFIDPNHELCLLARKIDWDALEKEFAPLYSHIGRPSIPIRTIVGLLLLKQMFNHGDETVMERWIENPYWQHFCGEIYFQYTLPFDPSDFVHFRKRIGEEGMKIIFQQSILLFGKETLKKATKEVRIDTTVQEKNITFPTDRKLYTKTLQYCHRIARKEGIRFKRTYARKIQELQYQLRFARKPKNYKKLSKLQGKYYKIVVKIYNDLIDQLTEDQQDLHYDTLDVLYRVLTQKRQDKDKVYSIHEPHVRCIAKGKEHKAYEFGNKSSFAYTREGGIIVGALAFGDNPYDGHTLEPQLEQIKELTGYNPKVAIVDRGYRGQDMIGKTQVVLPKNLKRESYYRKQQRKARQRSRAGVEGLISHLKTDHRMLKNYLSGDIGDKINTLLAASAYNMKKWMRITKQEMIFWLFRLFLQRDYNALEFVQISTGLKKWD